jgi:TolB-like protein
VVLPFANIGGDPELEYCVDDVTESLTMPIIRKMKSIIPVP